MSNITDYAEKAMLDWVLGGATPTRPTAWGIGIQTGVPNDSTQSDGTALLASCRLPVTFGAAASPGGSATNTAAITFGTFLTAGTIQGVHIWDTVTQNGTGGNALWWGTLATARAVSSGDSLVIASGALTITLA